MKSLIIGTAGHVDHGKTTLIKSLTGFDTDRLQEEKERQLSIDLGFAPFQLPSGRRAGVVDVPGHKRFMGNMLAGISGIDLVLLVIDVQEGIMPQTREHLNVLSLLGIEKGIIVLTKIDLAEDEWVTLMEEEVREELKGSSFEEAPLRAVSAVTGQGLDILLRDIDNLVDKVEYKNTSLPLRMFIDRVFTVKGFGTVVTGTLMEGRVTEGDRVQIHPVDNELRVRQIQVHGETVEQAFAGQRVALNIPDISASSLHRGHVVIEPDTFKAARIIDVKLKVLEESPHQLKDGSRVHLHLGSASVLARVKLLLQDRLLPGEEGLARLYLEDEVVTGFRDPFIIRFYSPVQTMGGGIVLDNMVYSGHKEEIAEYLSLLDEQGNPWRIQYALKKEGLLSYHALQRALDPIPPDLSALLDNLEEENRIVSLGDQYYLLSEDFERGLSQLQKGLEEYHLNNHLKEGMGKSELKEFFPFEISDSIFNLLLEGMEEEGLIRQEGEKIALSSFSPRPDEREEKLLAVAMDSLREGRYNPPDLDRLAKELELEKSELQGLLVYLVNREKLVKVDEELYYCPDVLEEIIELTVNYLEQEEHMKVAQFRDLLGTSRKYAIPLLEFLERARITRRDGDLHFLK